jgi:hypothetical protein
LSAVITRVGPWGGQDVIGNGIGDAVAVRQATADESSDPRSRVAKMIE